MVTTMQRLLLPASLISEVDDNSDQAFNVVIAYEDLPAGQRAMQIFSNLASDHGNDFILQPQPWRFDLLADPDWAEFAAGDALRADLLVISTSGGSDLPAHVRSWVTACLARKRGGSGAVVALLGTAGNMEDADSERLQFLQSAAEEAGLEFFAPLTRPKGPHHSTDGSTYCPAQSITGSLNDVRSSAPRHIAEGFHLGLPRTFSQVQYRHWGINE